MAIKVEKDTTNKRGIRITLENGYYDYVYCTVVVLHGDNIRVLNMCENKLKNLLDWLNISSMFPIIVTLKFEKIKNIEKKNSNTNTNSNTNSNQIIKKLKSPLYIRLFNRFIHTIA